jgi:hypothetical protein
VQQPEDEVNRQGENIEFNTYNRSREDNKVHADHFDSFMYKDYFMDYVDFSSNSSIANESSYRSDGETIGEEDRDNAQEDEIPVVRRSDIYSVISDNKFHITVRIAVIVIFFNLTEFGMDKYFK